MIANDARTIVYESMEKQGITIDDDVIQRVNSCIIEAAENLKFACDAELFPCDDERATVENRYKVTLYYHSLGYSCYVQPHDGMYKLVLRW